MPGIVANGRMMWYCVPSVIRMSSISSFKPSAFMVFIFARTTSVLPAAATSRSTPEPILPSAMPEFPSTTAPAIAPSRLIRVSRLSLIFAMIYFLELLVP